MAINNKNRRLVIFLSVVILSLCTASQCKKLEYFESFKGIDRIEGSKVMLTLVPRKKVYAVGDTISIDGTILAENLKLPDFSWLVSDLYISDFQVFFVDNLNVHANVFHSINSENLRFQRYSQDNRTYTFRRSYRLEKAGKFHIDYGIHGSFDKDEYGNRIYSTLPIRFSSGKKDPPGYWTDVFMYFTNNDKTFIEIEVE